MNMESAKKHTKVLILPHGAIPHLKLDPAKIRQVIENLLSNAIKYSPPGSTVSVEIQKQDSDVRGNVSHFKILRF
jgi:signal transduction histidine kinase